MSKPTTHRWLLIYIFLLVAGSGRNIWSAIKLISIEGGGAALITIVWAAILGTCVYGMFSRKLWAWRLNFVVLCIHPLNAWMASSGHNKGPLSASLFALVLLYLIFTLPNIIYFNKRKYLFDNGEGVHKYLLESSGRWLKVLESSILPKLNTSVRPVDTHAQPSNAMPSSFSHKRTPAEATQNKDPDSCRSENNAKWWVGLGALLFAFLIIALLANSTDNLGYEDVSPAISSRSYSSEESMSNYDVEREKFERRLIEAELGDADAQYSVGWGYYHGTGVSLSFEEAAKWFKKAAKQGNAAAQNYVGLMYETGRGIQQDQLRAVRCYRMAAEQGDPYAQNNLGRCYEYGTGVQGRCRSYYFVICKFMDIAVSLLKPRPNFTPYPPAF